MEIIVISVIGIMVSGLAWFIIRSFNQYDILISKCSDKLEDQTAIINDIMLQIKDLQNFNSIQIEKLNSKIDILIMKK
jgi:hypothetical protein